MKRNAPWSQAGRRAELITQKLQAHVFIDQPAQGLAGWPGFHDDDRLLGVDLPGFPDPIPLEFRDDCYVRQPDLIVTYQRPGADHLRAQLVWRQGSQSTSRGEIDGVLLIVSLQTDRLDARPLLHVVNQFHAASLWFATPQDSAGWHWQAAKPAAWTTPWLLVARPDDPQRSLVLAAMPHDVVRTTCSVADAATNSWRIEQELLGEHLEKGVIRRAQMAVWQVPRDGDQALAEELWQGFLTAAPPLTA